MEQKDSKIFDKKTMQAVSAFCSANNIKDIDDFIYRCFKQGFDIEKYGFLGKTFNEDEKDLKTGVESEKQVIKEVIVEKRVEIPVEVIKEIEKIVEVPVEIIKEIVVEKEIIKEVPVEKVVTKIEYISDKTSENELLSKIEKLEYEMSKKNEELDELRRNLDVNLDITVTNDKVKMLQTTIQNLNTEIRELKKKNEELNKKLLEQPKQVGEIPARFHGSSNLNDNLYK
jgi:predicted RNase H-like nuclease (RuvC/YqgF family)